MKILIVDDSTAMRMIVNGFITTEATPDMRAKAIGAGAKFLVSKPFTPESFKEHLGVHIR
jgi:CheY-like chemotaxis protein